MTRQRPVALGYVAARDAADMAAQRTLVAAYASTEGLALADVLDDHRDGLTIRPRFGMTGVSVVSDLRVWGRLRARDRGFGS